MYYTRDWSDISRDTPTSGQIDDHPGDYRPDADLVDAVNVAITLNRPLLLTGDPGTGKSQLAYSVAWQLLGRKAENKLNLQSSRVDRFEAKSTSVARDLFYSYDMLERLQDAGKRDKREFISFNALGLALLRAFPREKVQHVLPAKFTHEGPMRSVVLVDEIDKAPRDFPNDLLNEIDQMFFRIPELENAFVGGPKQLSREYFPLVFITSNSERNLPDPFLRRCIYYNIPFPGRDELHGILAARLKELMPVPGRLVDSVLDFFDDLRSRKLSSRKISPPELVQWIAYMLKNKADPDATLKENAKVALAGLCTLSKETEDQARLRNALKTRLGVN